MLAAGPSLVSFGYVRGPIRLEHEFMSELTRKPHLIKGRLRWALVNSSDA
jgi:hypothetical protein